MVPNTSTIEHIFFENGTTMVDKCITQMYRSKNEPDCAEIKERFRLF